MVPLVVYETIYTEQRYGAFDNIQSISQRCTVYV